MGEPLGIIPSGVPNLDTVLGGGLLESGLTVIAGGPGAGKATLVQQIACYHSSEGGRVLYVTALTEPHASLVAHLSRFTFFDPALLGDAIKIINVFPISRQGLGAVTSTILRALKDERSPFLVFDGFRSLRDLFSETREVRTFAYELAGTLSSIRATTLMTSEFAPHQMESAPEVLIADGLIVLDTTWSGVRQDRTLSVQKMRSGKAFKGPHTFTLDAGGISVFPRFESVYPAVTESLPGGRAEFGQPALDAALGGGLPRGTATLVSAPTGWGKSALALQFALAGARQGERCLYLSDSQNAGRLASIAAGLGLAGADLLGGDLVQVLTHELTKTCPDQLAWRVAEACAAASARRVVLDGSDSLAPDLGDRFGLFWRALGGQLSRLGATLLLTAHGDGGETLPPTGVFVDNLLWGQYRWQGGQMGRALWVAKMRDSAHDPSQYELTLGPVGIHLTRCRAEAATPAIDGGPPDAAMTEGDG
ncbi:MAG: RAD55 family ATPase [Chloroflexota bacterium]